MRTHTNFLPACLAVLFACAADVTGRPPVPVLCLAAHDTRSQGLDAIEPTALELYRRAGFDLRFDYYENVSAEDLRKYPVVVGMLAQLHQGTSVFKGTFGALIDAYLREGGSFVFFSGPSYYGTADFTEMQNPFLERFGAQLLKEVPRAEGCEYAEGTVLKYRYLRTEDILDSPYTGAAKELFLPLDYTDAYIRTHTARLSAEWQVLATAGLEAASYPHADLQKGTRQPGHWPQRPPVLALRKVDKGHFALFTTASEYFVWEAGHPAFSDGFVLKNGGLQLMSGLLATLAETSPFRGANVLDGQSDKAQVPRLPGLEVPVMSKKNAWYAHVLARLVPQGFGVRSYIDSGSLSDIAYTPDRARGYLDQQAGELIRSPGKSMFHATAANARGLGLRPVTYRFSGLNAAKEYCMGLLLWGFDKGLCRDLAVSYGDATETFTLPGLHHQQGPRFVLLEGVIPDAQGVLDVVFARGAGGEGTFSAVGEIWLFESGAQLVREAADVAEFNSIKDGTAAFFPEAKVWKGLIGARSPADGGAPVAELAAAAHGCGLDFIAYTDAVGQHDQQSFAELRSACDAASASGCAVFAGVSFTDRYQERPQAHYTPMGKAGTVSGYVFQPLTTLPAAKDFGTPSTLFWRFFGGAYSGGNAAVPTLTQPGVNGIKPWHQRFWRGLDVMTFDAAGTIIDDARELYVDLLSAGYGPQPRVSGIYRTAEQIKAAVSRGWLTLSTAPSPSKVATHTHATHVTSGPVIQAFRAVDNNFNSYNTGGGLVFGEPEWFVLRVETAYTGSLKRVSLYADHQLVRRWFPQRQAFTVTEPLRLLRTAEYRLHVEAEDGREAFSGRFQTVARDFASSMCADNQNTITSVFKQPSRFVYDERETYMQHSYWHTGGAAGQMGVMLDASRIVPRVDETGVVQPCKFFHPCPSIVFRQGPAENHHWSALRMGERSPDASQVIYSYEAANAAFASETKLTAWCPGEGDPTALMLETELIAKRAVASNELERIVLLELGLRPEIVYPGHYAVIDANGETAAYGKISTMQGGQSPVAQLTQGAMAGIWTNGVGSLFAVACDQAPKQVSFAFIENAKLARERMTVWLPPRSFSAGERTVFKHLVLLVPGAFPSVDTVKKLRQRVLDPFAECQLSSGTLLAKGPVLKCGVSESHAVSGELRMRSGHAGRLPLEVNGVCPSWPLALDCGSGLRLMGSSSDTLRAVISPAAGTVSFTIGNLLLSDSTNIIIEADTVSKNGVSYLVHNPTEQTITCVVRSNPAFSKIPAFNNEVTVRPGQTAWRNSGFQH